MAHGMSLHIGLNRVDPHHYQDADGQPWDGALNACEFDAHDLSTRQINLELRWLINEQGITDVTVRNPGSKHSLGVGILTRCKITFDGSLGYFGCGIIDGPEVHIKGRVGWSSCENMMSGVVVIESNAGSLTGAALRGGDLVVKGQVGARSGIDQKGGTIITLGSAGSMTGFMMQRGRQILCGDVGPGLHLHDLTLGKTFSLTERLKFTFMAAAQNLFNHANFNNPSANLSAPGSYGVITSTRGFAPGRQVMLRSRIEF